VRREPHPQRCYVDLLALSKRLPRRATLEAYDRRHSCTRNDLSLREREGWRSLRKALASVWRMRSRVTAND
jgi:hypothetical protein